MTASSNIYLSPRCSSAVQQFCRSPACGQPAAPHRIVFFFLCWTIISIFYQFIQFLEIAASGEVRVVFIFSFIFLLTQQSPCGVASVPAAAYPARRFSSPPFFRGGRPVAAGTIGKQRPKIYFPVSFPLPMGKHSNRSRKNVVGPQFLLTMILSSSRRNVFRH